MMLTTTAPGKLMLMGEYAVLFGGKAVVAAIDRVARCTLDHAQPFSFCSSLTNGSRNADISIVHAISQALDHHDSARIEGAFTLDTSAFFDRDQKIGFGSSAAAVVALSAMLLQQRGITDRKKLFEVAFNAHRTISSGVGSGADVAAAVFGGVILYQNLGQPEIKTLSSSLFDQVMVVNTKQSQKTTPMVQRIIAYADHHANLMADFCRRSDQLCSAFITHAHDLQKCIPIINEATALLTTLGHDVGIDIVSAPHRAIASIALAFEGAAKPSGAGGGDLCLAYVPHHHRQQFAKKVHQSGFEIVNVQLYV